MGGEVELVGGEDGGELVAEDELTAVFVGAMQVTPLLPPWASQLPLLFVVLHPAVPSEKQTNRTAIGTRLRHPALLASIMGPFSGWR